MTGKPIADSCTICEEGYRPTEDIQISQTPHDGVYIWAHRSCWLDRKSETYKKYESTQFFEAIHGFVSSKEPNHESLSKRADIPHRQRISAEQIEWEDFLIKLYTIFEHETEGELGAVYVVGSLANGTAVAGSDMDIICGVSGEPLDAGTTYNTLYKMWRECEPILREELIVPISEIHVVHTTTAQQAPSQALGHQGQPPTRQYYPPIIYDPILDVKWGRPNKARDRQHERNQWFEARQDKYMSQAKWSVEKMKHKNNE